MRIFLLFFLSAISSEPWTICACNNRFSRYNSNDDYYGTDPDYQLPRYHYGYCYCGEKRASRTGRAAASAAASVGKTHWNGAAI